MAEAREAIGDAISAAIVKDFKRELEQWLKMGDTPGPPALVAGDCAAGHDASRVPAVPRARLSVDRESASPGVIFTWKAESGDPPHVFAQVPAHWLRDVVRPGYAVIEGRPVLQILARMPGSGPAQILAVVVGGYYDTQLHGWRAHGRAVACNVAWAPDGSARVE